MAMTQEKFDTLVERLETFARQQLGTYKLRVGLLAALGYAYIFLILAGLIFLLGLLVLLVLVSHSFNIYIIKFGILLLIPTFIILRSLWVTFPPPTGLPLRRQEAPHLFSLVDELTSKLQTPRFHHILLTNEFNAGVVQRPRLGLLGWQQNYLIVGLPLIQALSMSQFRAVLAHELGHLSDNHSRFAGWIYRVRKTQAQIWERLHQSGHGSSVLFEWFFNWYIPFFEAYSFVLARMNEYEADRCAAELAGAKNTAEALINTEIKATFLEKEFWPSLEKQIHHQIEPPAAIFNDMAAVLENPLTSPNATLWFQQVLKRKTTNSDTHPCLSDRLTALGYLPKQQQSLPLPDPVKSSAAQELLGDSINNIAAYFNSNWKLEFSTVWRQKYAYYQEVKQKLQALEEKAQKQPLSIDEAWEIAAWTLEIKGDEPAIPLLQELLKMAPDRSVANYTLGQILLQKNDAAGIEYIEAAMKKDPDYVMDGCNSIYSFLVQQDKLPEAKVYQKRADEHYNLLLMAQKERSNITTKDKFIPHGLPNAAVDRLRQQLSVYPEIKAAYLVKKDLAYFPEKPHYILGIQQNVPWYQWQVSDRDRAILNKLVSEVEYPGETSVIILNDYMGNNKPFEQMIAKIEGARIYAIK